MRSTPNPLVEKYRVKKDKDPMMGSDTSFGNNGVFVIPGPLGVGLQIVCSDGGGWEHVSVTTILPKHKRRCPYWDEMAYVKKLFWEDDEATMELHVPLSDHISLHDYVLHLWKPVDQEIPRPPAWMVGVTKRHHH